jgi:predicted aspartyl protease
LKGEKDETKKAEVSWSDSNEEYIIHDEFKFITQLNEQPKQSKKPMRIPVQLSKSEKQILALVDTGASKSIVSSELTKTVAGQVKKSSTNFEIVNGALRSNGVFEIQFTLPTLKRKAIISHQFEILDKSNDDMIIGRDLLSTLGIVINFKDNTMEWDGNVISFNPIKISITNSTVAKKRDAEQESSISPEQLLPQLDGKEAQEALLQLLTEFQHLYSGRLGKIKLPDYVLPVADNYVPEHAKPYPIPKAYEPEARKEIDRLIELGVLEKTYSSETASPAFFIKKPSGALRLLNDFRRLNKYLRRAPYFVPLIREVLTRLGNATVFSSMDANMGYYARVLSEESRKYTAFCLPFGKFQYKRLPMGISTAPDEYQAAMTRILGDLSEFVIVYLDDILVFSNTMEEHLSHLRAVFERLQEYDVTLNAKKCHFVRKEVNYLGYTLTADGIKPQAKKVAAIMQLEEPKTRKQLRRFLGMITYYREMIRNKSALTSVLTALTSTKVPFKWTSTHSTAFHRIKDALAEAVLLAYPDFTIPFHVYADASGKQLGGIIMQNDRILACFSRTLTKHQKNYTTMELELLSIVEILKEYRHMLLGQRILVHSDHKNLLYPTENNLRVKRWKLLLQEYQLEMHYIKGEKNIGADSFSRLPRNSSSESSVLEELFVVEEECLLNGDIMKKYQLDDHSIKKTIEEIQNSQHDPDYRLEPRMGSILLTFKHKVVVPESVRKELIIFYHQNLIHPGVRKQIQTMKQIFWFPEMSKMIDSYISNCITCKKAKAHGGRQHYGEIPLKKSSTTVNPFDEVHVDIIGPYEGFYALTVIESQFRWLEVSIQENKTSKVTAENFDTIWLCRYPRPLRVIHDLGSEFVGNEFQELLQSYGIKSKPITAKNPQANALCERVHLDLMNMVRCYPDVPWTKSIQYAAFAVRAGYHTILNASPCQLVFGQDMLTRELFHANWNYLSKRRYLQMMRDNERENQNRIQHIYKIGDVVMCRVPPIGRKKTEQVAQGPYIIKEVYENGTVLLDKGSVEDRVHIRRIFPC